mgnify:CR=1 FL=1
MTHENQREKEKQMENDRRDYACDPIVTEPGNGRSCFVAEYCSTLYVILLGLILLLLLIIEYCLFYFGKKKKGKKKTGCYVRRTLGVILFLAV